MKLLYYNETKIITKSFLLILTYYIENYYIDNNYNIYIILIILIKLFIQFDSLIVLNST